MSSRPLRVLFVHPDLGIGGAERLIVDAALGLQSLCAYRVSILTSHHDKKHAFTETRDGTINVKVFGDFLPTKLLGGGAILCAIVRSLYLSAAILCTEPPADVYVVDQIAIPVAILKLTGARVIFYCHFPDRLLAAKSESIARRLYRMPFDIIEEVTTAMADRVLVNSRFTQRTFNNEFTLISHRVHPTVLYPAINFSKYADAGDDQSQPITAIAPDVAVFVSINRYERKKNIALAISAFAIVHRENARSKLIVAGGYDRANAENVAHFPELKTAAVNSGLTVSDYPDCEGACVFMRSFSDSERSALLHRATAVVYTPANEHFGIVPVEAMYAGAPVIACNSGGPVESIIHGETGFLCSSDAESFAAAMREVLSKSSSERAALGKAGRQRVIERFALSKFSSELDSVIRDVYTAPTQPRSLQWTALAFTILILTLLIVFAR